MHLARINFSHLLAEGFRRVAPLITAAIARLGFRNVLEQTTDALIRVRRNGSSSSPHKQAPKTPQHSAVAKLKSAGVADLPITVLFHSHAKDEAVVELEIPAAKFARVEAAARRAGQPLSDFLDSGISRMIAQMEANVGGETPVGPALEGGNAASIAPVQDAPSVRKEEQALIEKLSPKALADDFEDRLSLLRDEVKAAVALALMNGELIEQAAGNLDGFADGVMILARNAGFALDVFLEDYTSAHKALVAHGKTLTGVVGQAAMSLEDEAGLLDRIGCGVDSNPGQQVDAGCRALSHLLKLQSFMLNTRGFPDAGFANGAAGEDLCDEVQAVSKASERLKAAVAIVEDNRQQQRAA